MSRTITAIAAATVIAAATTATAASAAMTPEQVAARAPVTFIDDCVGDPQHAPANITLTCADAGYQLDKLQWTDWGADRATGRGEGVANLCEPTCADGKYARFPVTVTADRIVNGEAAARYQRIVVTAGAGRPSFIDASETYRMTGHGPLQVEHPAATPGTVFTAWGAGWRAVVKGTSLKIEGQAVGQRVVKVTRQAFSKGVDFIGTHSGRKVTLHVTGGTCRVAGQAPAGYRAKLTVGRQTVGGCAVPRVIPTANT